MTENKKEIGKADDAIETEEKEMIEWNNLSKEELSKWDTYLAGKEYYDEPKPIYDSLLKLKLIEKDGNKWKATNFYFTIFAQASKKYEHILYKKSKKRKVVEMINDKLQDVYGYEDAIFFGILEILKIKKIEDYMAVVVLQIEYRSRLYERKEKNVTHGGLEIYFDLLDKEIKPNTN